MIDTDSCHSSIRRSEVALSTGDIHCYIVMTKYGGFRFDLPTVRQKWSLVIAHSGKH